MAACKPRAQSDLCRAFQLDSTSLPYADGQQLYDYPAQDYNVFNEPGACDYQSTPYTWTHSNADPGFDFQLDEPYASYSVSTHRTWRIIRSGDLCLLSCLDAETSDHSYLHNTGGERC